jgi:hypothetical protein
MHQFHEGSIIESGAEAVAHVPVVCVSMWAAPRMLGSCV